jgi:hypothetical protein
MKRCLPTNTRLATVVATVVFAACSLTSPAVAASASRNPNVIAGTVYDGEFAPSQNTWGGVQVQFVVTGALKVTNVAPAEAFCEPVNSLPLSSATISNDAFSVSTSASIRGVHITLSGNFTAGGKAEGTGKLVGETIQSEPCTEIGDWSASALPKGTQLCPDVDTGLLPRPTVTNMTCAKAALAFAAGVRQSQKNTSSDTFDIPGYSCTGSSADPDVRETCTRGNETLRLP